MSQYLQPKPDSLALRPSGVWAKVKLDYLARYISVFETAMRTKWKRRCYIDLMAGPGKNLIEDTNEIVLGSPLIALTTQFPFTDYYFVEFDKTNAEALEQRCRLSPHFGGVHIEKGDCNVVVDDVVKALKKTETSSLNLAFLDPEGFEMTWETVAKLATIKRMDLIINYSQGGLNRLMPKLVENKGNTILDSFFGGQEWRKLYRESPPNLLHRSLMDLYKSKLHELGYKEIIGDDEILHSEPLMRNTKQAPLYRLLFASKHPLGDDFWKKVTRRDIHGQASLF